MNLVIRALDRIVTGFNTLPLWRTPCRVWDQPMASGSFDRWLYLQLHRFGLMGRSERAALSRLIRPGMTVVDVGANLGLYTVLLARLVGPTGRVLAFEPDPDLFALLKASCQRDGLAHVEAHNIALGSRRDRLVLKKMAFNSGDNHLGAGGGTVFRHTVTVDVVALDEIEPGLHPDVLKIDVQGWELEVLRGASHLLETAPNCEVLLEFWPAGCRRAGYEPAALLEFFYQRGYSLWRPGETEPLSTNALAKLTADCSGLKHADLIARNRGQ